MMMTVVGGDSGGCGNCGGVLVALLVGCGMVLVAVVLVVVMVVGGGSSVCSDGGGVGGGLVGCGGVVGDGREARCFFRRSHEGVNATQA